MNLHDKMVDAIEEYEGEYATNTESIVYNVMFILFEACGVDGPEDFVKYKIKPISIVPGCDNYTHPLTCCDGLIDQFADLPDQIKDSDLSKDSWEKIKNEQLQYFDECEKKPNEEGSYPVLKKYLTILFVVVLLFLLVLVLFLTLLVCAACNVIKKGPKKDKWAKKYNGEEQVKVTEKSRITKKTKSRAG